MDPVHFTRLKLMARSPAHYLAGGKPPTAAMENGTALHSVLLGGKPFIVYDGIRRGKGWEQFAADHEDATILNPAGHEKVLGMAESISHHKEAMRLLEGRREVELDWQFLGRACAGRVDVIGPGYLTELKSCSTAHPDRFQWQALRMGYHAQLAWYREGVVSRRLGTPTELYIVAVESSAPYPVTVMRLTERAIEHGQKAFRLWMERLLQCEAADYWPGYTEAIVDLDVPEDVELQFAEDAVTPGGSTEVPF
jgi:hypothetical protein